jgi:hypothetical protein
MLTSLSTRYAHCDDMWVLHPDLQTCEIKICTFRYIFFRRLWVGQPSRKTRLFTQGRRLRLVQFAGQLDKGFLENSSDPDLPRDVIGFTPLARI